MKVILAVDTYDKNTVLSPAIYKDLKQWCGNLKTDVLPVYVSSRAMESELTLPPVFQEFAPLKVLFSGKGRRKEADVLLEYAEEQQASVLALISAGKPTQSQGVFGSFAEAIILRSHKPLLFLSENAASRFESGKKVLFFTDYSDSSYQAFSIFLDQMKESLPKIVVFHALTLPSLANAGTVYAQALNLLPASYWAAEESKAYKKGERFVEIAQKSGYQAKQLVFSKVSSVQQAIEKVVQQEEISLIAAVILNGQKLPGSVHIEQKHIANNIENPFWICGPRAVGS